MTSEDVDDRRRAAVKALGTVGTTLFGLGVSGSAAAWSGHREHDRDDRSGGDDDEHGYGHS